MIQRHVFVKGRVQGVGFRLSLVREARKYAGLRGFVRNLDDGRVEAVFLGEQGDVLALVAWCKVGPPSAQVKELDVREEKTDSSLESFEIQAG